MPKKIYDIKPPKAASNGEKVAKLAGAKAAPKRRRVATKKVAAAPEMIHTPTPAAKKETFPRLPGNGRPFPLVQTAIGGGVVVLLLLAGYFYLTLGSATIHISPKTDTLSFVETVTADKSYDNVNLLKKVIPARVLTAQKSVTQQFPATGNASNAGQATGTITVYNKITPPAPLSLKTGTHFLSDGGKYFVTLSKIVVPAMKGSTPGSINVNVQAQESGADYNIGPSKFSVPGLSGSSYYYSIYGSSTSAMSGGYTGNVKKVTADDISGAKDVLVKKVSDDLKASLQSQISPDEVLLGRAIAAGTTTASADAKEGAVQQNFNETANVSETALVFKKEDIQKFALLDAQSKLADGKDLVEKTVSMSYDPVSVNTQSGIETITLKVSATEHFVIDASPVINSLVGKSASQIEDVITTQFADKISSVKVNFWPFWVSRAPKDPAKIKVSLDL